jgi:hypothetical protein
MKTGDPKALAFFNREANITAGDGMRYALTEEDFRELNQHNYWHHRTDPSSWLIAATVTYARRRFKDRLTRDHIIKLCADTLNITPEKLESTLDWNANYLAWHDGMAIEDTHPFPREPQAGA